MEIIEYNSKYETQVKNLLNELQEYIVKIDKFNLNIITEEYKQKYLNATLKEVYENNGKMFLAVEETNVVGMICGYIYPYLKDDYIDYKCPKKGIVSELIVSKQNRKNGIGQKLLEKIENYFKITECKYVQIDVFAYNDMARKFYAKNSYEERLITVSKKI